MSRETKTTAATIPRRIRVPFPILYRVTRLNRTFRFRIKCIFHLYTYLEFKHNFLRHQTRKASIFYILLNIQHSVKQTSNTIYTFCMQFVAKVSRFSTSSVTQVLLYCKVTFKSYFKILMSRPEICLPQSPPRAQQNLVQ